MAATEYGGDASRGSKMRKIQKVGEFSMKLDDNARANRGISFKSACLDELSATVECSSLRFDEQGLFTLLLLFCWRGGV